MFELRGSADLQYLVQNSKAKVRKGRWWDAMQAVGQAIHRLKHQKIIRLLQPGRAGFFGWGPVPRMWSKANPIQFVQQGGESWSSSTRQSSLLSSGGDWKIITHDYTNLPSSRCALVHLNEDSDHDRAVCSMGRWGWK